MKRWMIIALFGTFFSMQLCYPGISHSKVNVNIAVQLPPLAITAAPAMVPIPGTYAYYAPDVQAGLFFCNGYWYRPYQGGWYTSVQFNGPWGSVAIGNVPSAIVGYVGYPRDGYGSTDANPMNGGRHGMGMGMMGMGRRMR
jgi:hypothetical protein